MTEQNENSDEQNQRRKARLMREFEHILDRSGGPANYDNVECVMNGEVLDDVFDPLADFEGNWKERVRKAVHLDQAVTSKSWELPIDYDLKRDARLRHMHRATLEPKGFSGHCLKWGATDLLNLEYSDRTSEADFWDREKSGMHSCIAYTLRFRNPPSGKSGVTQFRLNTEMKLANVSFANLDQMVAFLTLYAHRLRHVRAGKSGWSTRNLFITDNSCLNGIHCSDYVEFEWTKDDTVVLNRKKDGFLPLICANGDLLTVYKR
jgi:hypothetical protein